MGADDKQSYVTRPGAEIAVYYRDQGQAWVVLVNGHTRPGSDFRSFMRYLAENGFSSLTLDNRGAGETRHARAFKLEDMVEDIRASMDEVGVRRAHVLGISMGGVLVQHLAASSPGYVESLGLVSTTCRDEYLLGDSSEWQDDLESIREKMRPYFSKRFFDANKLLVDAMCKQIQKKVRDGDFATGAAAQRNAIKTYDTVQLLDKIDCPVGVFHGSEDKIISARVVEEFRRHLPKAQQTVYPGVGHLLLAECPKQLYQDYLEFLRNIGD